MTGPLRDVSVSPIVAVGNLERSREFYETTLGLRGEPAPGGGWNLHAGNGTRITLLSGVDTAGSADWPVATFQVGEIHAIVRELRDRGVPFLTADDIPFALDEDGVSSTDDGLSVAWMRDPDGNILTVFSTSPAG